MAAFPELEKPAFLKDTTVDLTHHESPEQSGGSFRILIQPTSPALVPAMPTAFVGAV